MGLTRLFGCGCLLGAMLLLASPRPTCRAGQITGDPLADGWAYQGNSLDPGHYVRGSGLFSFDLYSTAMILDASSELLGAGSTWEVGDLVLGIGARFVPHPLYPTANANLLTTGGPPSYPADTTPMRLLGKFSTAGSRFRPAEDGIATSGDGRDYFSSGDGGEGSVQLVNHGYPLHAGGAYPGEDPAAPYLSTALDAMVYDGGPTPITSDIGRLIYAWDEATNQLASFEIFLNTSLLQRLGYLLVPSPGDAYSVQVQREMGANTSAMARSPRNVQISQVEAVPEPSTVAAACVGLGLAGAWARRRLRRRRPRAG